MVQSWRIYFIPRLVVAALLCVCCLKAHADESTIPLSRYLALANQAGFDLIYSSALVRPHFKVTFDSEKPFTLEKIRSALNAYQLKVRKSASGRLLVARQRKQEISNQTEPYQPWDFSIEEIVVTSSLHEFKLNHVAAAVHLDRDSLANRPVFANDVFRVTGRLPGAANDGVSSRSAVRGGRPNETLIRLDGMRLYEPFHLNRFNQLFSVLDARLVESMDFLTGGFPAKFGDRLSGVLDITPVSPAELDPFTEVGIGLYTASVMRSGQLKNHDYLLSVRRSTIDLLGRLAKSDLGTPAFSDLFFSVDSELSANSRLSTNVLWFGDDLSINNSAGSEETDSTYGNTYVWSVLRHDRSNGSGSETRIGFAAIKDDRQGFVRKPGLVSGSVADDQEFRVYVIDHRETFQVGRVVLSAGADYRYLDAEYGFESALDIDSNFRGVSNYDRPGDVSISESFQGSQASAFLTVKFSLAEVAFIEAGVRADGQDYVDGGFETEFTPRINLLIHPFFGGDLRLSWGRFTQAPGIHELDISEGIDYFQAPQKATHRIASYTRPIGLVDFRLEMYQKSTSNPAFYFENLSDPLSLVPELQIDRQRIDPESVTARGAELSLSGFVGKSEWWLNYTRAEVEEVVAGKSVRRQFDQKHSANVGWSMMAAGWRTTVEASYHSGWPTSALQVDENLNLLPTLRNDQRLPHYLSVDFKARKIFRLNNSELKVELGLSNLTNRKNQIGTRYGLESGQWVETPTHALPLAPFIDVFWRF